MGNPLNTELVKAIILLFKNQKQQEDWMLKNLTHLETRITMLERKEATYGS